MEIVFCEMTWRIEVSITGSFGETRLLQSFLEVGCDQAVRCRSNFLGFISEASRFQFRTNNEDSDSYHGFPYPLKEKN
jgi:hypothetical protein